MEAVISDALLLQAMNKVSTINSSSLLSTESFKKHQLQCTYSLKKGAAFGLPGVVIEQISSL